MLLATHLLDDVQQVCDHVIMLDGGRLVVSGSTSGLLERTGVLTVDVGPERDGLVALLAERGLKAVEGPSTVEVQVQDDDDIDRVRDAMADLGLPLHRMTIAAHVARRRVPRQGDALMVVGGGRRRLRPGVPRLRGRAAAASAPHGGRCSVASVRRALGIRRPWRQKVAPFVLLGIATVPAIVFVGVGYVTRDTLASDFEWITYREYVGVSTLPARCSSPSPLPTSCAPTGGSGCSRCCSPDRSPAPTT